MHGLGDNIHQRAIVRQLTERHEVFLETSWPAVYHDLPVKCVFKRTILRTQAKNAARQAAAFVSAPTGPRIRVRYTPQDIRSTGSVLGAMCKATGADVSKADFSLPVPDEWKKQASAILSVDKPLLIYRPLVERREWGGCAARNPDREAYAQLFASIRDRYFVVSIADLVPGVEWIVSEPIKADAEFHSGEFHFEALAGLFSMASLVFASPGFAVPLAQAVGTPVVCVFGGYESSRSFSTMPYLGIDAVNPCECFSHNHRCDKRIDMPQALGRLQEYVNAAAS